MSGTNKSETDMGCAQAFADTINAHNDGLSFPNMTDCESYGMTFGCTPECPTYLSGKCEIEEENKEIFAKETSQ